MTYVTNNGAHKYEAVITLRVRFDMQSSNVGDARYGARLISEVVEEFAKTHQRINAEDVTVQNPNNPYEQMVDVTYASTNVEAIDHANQSVHNTNIWLEGAYMSVSSLTSLWNRELRTINDRNGEYSHVRMLDTGEASYGDKDIITLPSMPESMLRESLMENVGNMTTDFVKRRNSFVRDVAIRTLEGLYEDGVDMPSKNNNSTSEYVGVTVVNGQVVQSPPEPF